VIGMVADPELPPDHRRHPLGGPDLPAKAVRLGTPCQQHRHLHPLLDGQFRGRTRQRPASQRFDAALAPTSHPLADRPSRHSQRLRNRLLAPSPLLQVPSSEPPLFSPLLRPCCFLCHTSAPCRPETTLAPYAEISNSGRTLDAPDGLAGGPGGSVTHRAGLGLRADGSAIGIVVPATLRDPSILIETSVSGLAIVGVMASVALACR